MPIQRPNIPTHTSSKLSFFPSSRFRTFSCNYSCKGPYNWSVCFATYWSIVPYQLRHSCCWLFGVHMSLLFTEETRAVCLSGTQGEQQCFYRAVSVQTKPSKYIPTRSNIILEVQHVDFHFTVSCHGKFICIFLGCVDGISLAWSPWSCQMSCSCYPFETTEPPSKLKVTNFPSVSLQHLK